jgi:chemotaxis family two-component system response regulator Rcp1
MTTGKHIEILLVEDNPGDVTLITEALKDAKVYNTLHVARDGVEAMQYLHDSLDPDSGVSRPGLILLDLNLPRKDGREVLKEAKSDEKLRSIPIVVMTTSKDEEDIIKAYDSQANCYITKPVDFDQLMKVVHTIEDFWLTLVQLPQGDD